MNLIVKVDSIDRSVFSCGIVRRGCHGQRETILGREHTGDLPSADDSIQDLIARNELLALADASKDRAMREWDAEGIKNLVASN